MPEGLDELSQEHALVALLNSTPLVRGRQQDLLDDAPRAVLDAFGATTGGELRQVRDVLQEITRGTAPVSVLQAFLEPVVQVPRLEGDGLVWHLQGQEPALAPARAALQWLEVQEKLPGRLRACENPECAKFLLDHSRANVGRWCSMAECGNRFKARRHAARASTRLP